MPEGQDYITFQGQQVGVAEANENYQYWKDRENIPDEFEGIHGNILSQLKQVFGAHTIPGYVVIEEEKVFPLLSKFNYNQKSGKFVKPDEAGLKSDRELGREGPHMATARALGIDSFVFSYMGMHTPYHRQKDRWPICPFGFFIEVRDFAFNHGTPCDRSFASKNYTELDNLNRYFLVPEDLQKLVTNRIITDPFFGGAFEKYFGNVRDWEDPEYRKNHWQKKGELCYFKEVKPSDIRAVLWPVWEEYAIDEGYEEDDLQKYMGDFKDTFDIDIIIYRPYLDIIDKESWNDENYRDWELALVEASSVSQEYFLKFGTFPSSIIQAKETLNALNDN